MHCEEFGKVTNRGPGEKGKLWDGPPPAKAVLDHDKCFHYAGVVLGFSASKGCPDGDREWLKDAGDQFKLLAFAHFHPGAKP